MSQNTVSRKGERDELLILDGVSMSYGDVRAVEAISICVHRGEFLTLLGPSGSGKTTTLMMIAGFTFPSTGKVLFRGEEITFKPAQKRNMGVVFQNYALFKHMSVFENVAFPLRARGTPSAEIDRRVRAILGLVQLSELAERLPDQLSGGQQQRVALARALVFEPPLLLMDEPLGAIDRKLRIRMQVEIRRIQQLLGLAAVYVTHDQEEALVMSDRIAVMAGGRVKQVDTPQTIYDRPRNRFVAEFVGEANILSAQVLRNTGDWCLATMQSSGTICVRGHGRHEIGQHIDVCVRPERIRVADQGPEINVHDGIVREVTYLGEITKYEIEIGPDVVVTMKEFSRTAGSKITGGDKVRIGWQHDDGWILPEP